MAKRIVPKATRERDVREIEEIPGIGGFIEFRWNVDTDDVVSRIEIEEWSIVHHYVNARLAMTGGLGSIQYRRVADSFDFAVMAVMDLRTTRAQEPGPGSSAQPFYDGRLEGAPEHKFLISMHFQCADSTFWDYPEAESLARPEPKFPRPLNSGIYQTCAEVILDKVRLADSSRGDDVLRYFIEGHGSKPLQRWVGEQWVGGGAFGVGEALNRGLEGDDEGNDDA